MHTMMTDATSPTAANTAANPISADDARRAVRNVGALVVASLLSKGVLFGWQIALGLLLGPAQYGIYSTVLGIFAIGTALSSFSMGLIAIREIAANPDDTPQIAGAMLWTQTALSGAAYVGVVVLGALVDDGSGQILAFSAIAGISLVIDLFGNIGHDLLLAQERMITTSIIDVAQILLRVGIAAYLLLTGWGLFGLYAASIGVGLLRSLALWIVHARRGLRVDWRWNPAIAGPLLLNAAPLAGMAFLAMLYSHADKLMTTGLLDSESTGYLTPAFIINFGVIELLSTTVLVAMYPLMSRAYDADASEVFGFIVETLARFMLLAALPIALVLSIFADEFILRLYSTEYVPTIAILRIFIWYTLLTMIGNVFAKALIIQNKQRWTLVIRVVTLSINIALNAVLLLRYRDPRGAAVASVITEALSLFLMARIFGAAGFAWERLLPGLSRTLLVGGVSAGLMIGLGLLSPWLGVLVGGVVYVIGAFWTLSSAEWDLFYRLLASLPGGGIVRRYWKRDVILGW